MLINIPDVLTAEQVAEGRKLLDSAEWVDGKVTAGHQSARAKNNAQVPEGHPVAQKLGDMILSALGRNPLFLSAALPLRVFPPLFNRYAGGQSFGTHVDNAIRQVTGTPHRIRTDLSATLFFARPDEYDGGELCVEDIYGVQRVKLPPGHLVLYPSTSLHHVTPVTRGARVSSFFWIQSMVRDDAQRSLLFDLDLAIQRLGRDLPGNPVAEQTSVQLTGVYHNLFRQLAEVLVMSFRKVIFWVHLTAGLVAGIVILIMSATGVVLAFEKEIIAWAERDVRRVTPLNEAKALSLDEMLATIRQTQAAPRSAGLTVYADPRLAATVSLGRTNGFYVNPYTGDVKSQTATKTRAFMQAMIDWHRYLGAQGDSRPRGKAITGACNAAFCLLAMTGLYLWWPRQWTKSVLRSVTLFDGGLRGKARDWNWHNVIGIWSAPVLIVVTATAMPISYRWATDLIYKLTRSEAPAPAGAGSAVKVPTPPAGAQPLSYAELLASVQQHAPQWQQITVRPGGGGGRGGERSGERAQDAPRGENRAEPQPVNFVVKQRDGSPRFATAQFSVNPFTGEILRAERYSDYNFGRRVRSWTRFLHTGEALGPAGQLAAGLASLGAMVLFYTGFALAWRRFLRWRQPPAPNAAAPILESTVNR